MRHVGHALCTAFLVSSLGTAAFASDALTQADYQYLGTLGWARDNAALKQATDPQRAMLHRLINDPNMSGKKKEDAVSDYLNRAGNAM